MPDMHPEYLAPARAGQRVSASRLNAYTRSARRGILTGVPGLGGADFEARGRFTQKHDQYDVPFLVEPGTNDVPPYGVMRIVDYVTISGLNGFKCRRQVAGEAFVDDAYLVNGHEFIQDGQRGWGSFLRSEPGLAIIADHPSWAPVYGDMLSIAFQLGTGFELGRGGGSFKCMGPLRDQNYSGGTSKVAPVLQGPFHRKCTAQSTSSTFGTWTDHKNIDTSSISVYQGKGSVVMSGNLITFLCPARVTIFVTATISATHDTLPSWAEFGFSELGVPRGYLMFPSYDNAGTANPAMSASATWQHLITSSTTGTYTLTMTPTLAGGASLTSVKASLVVEPLFGENG